MLDLAEENLAGNLKKARELELWLEDQDLLTPEGKDTAEMHFPEALQSA